MRYNKFELLRLAIREHYMTNADLAKYLGRSLCYVSSRMSGAKSWELSDIYAIMDILDIPVYQMPAYFTRNGERPDPNMVCPPLTKRQVDVISAYEQSSELQPAINVLLGIEKISDYNTKVSNDFSNKENDLLSRILKK